MAVYVDAAIWPFAGRRWCHLMADEVDELHRFAAALGVRPVSYQGPPRTSAPHYDITGFERSRAVALGAVPCTRAEIVAILRRVRVRGPDGAGPLPSAAGQPAPRQPEEAEDPRRSVRRA